MNHPRKSYTNHAENRCQISENGNFSPTAHYQKKNLFFWKFESLNKKSGNIPETGTQITHRIGV